MDISKSDLEAIRQTLGSLTARIYRIERKLGIDPAAALDSLAPSEPAPEIREAEVPVSSPTVVAEPESPRQARAFPPVPVIPPRPVFSQPVPESETNLESRIGSHWLNRIGITALLIGVSYFLKFAFDNNWIGPAGRVTIGLLAGIAVVAWSERFRSRGHLLFSHSLKAVGIGTLYLSLWAAFQVYDLVPSSAAFVMMLAVTAATAAMALAQDAEILAAFALTGGFSTPLLLSTGANRELALFAYVAILDLAALLLVTFKPWRRLLVMSYAGTVLLYAGWYFEFYGKSQFNLTIGFATLFFAIFAVAPLVTLQPEGENSFFASIPAILAFINAGVYFLQAYGMVADFDAKYMAWFALVLAAVYIALSRQVRARLQTERAREILYFLHLALAIGFVTVAIPIRLDAHWITLGWFVEAGVLLGVANRVKSDFLNLFALGALILGVIRLLLIDNFVTTRLLFNARMATYAVAVAVLGTVAWYAAKREDDMARTVSKAALIALNVLALMSLSYEVSDYFSRALTDSRALLDSRSPTFWANFHGIEIERDFTYSALFMAYGAMLMVVGFVRRTAFVRWQALLLIAATIVKVFIYDVWQLDKGYRIVSFIVLGVLLLAISFVYQRDWLQLSAKAQTSEEGAGA